MGPVVFWRILRMRLGNWHIEHKRRLQIDKRHDELGWSAEALLCNEGTCIYNT